MPDLELEIVVGLRLHDDLYLSRNGLSILLASGAYGLVAAFGITPIFVRRR